MTGFISNIIWNSVGGFVEAGTRTAGGYAGDALVKAGDLIEGAGRSVGNGIERTASGYGGKLSSGAPGGASTAAAGKKNVTAVKRSNSSPASSKAASARASAPGNKKTTTTTTPLGANKYPGGGNARGGAQKAIGGVGTGAYKAIGGGAKNVAAKTNSLPKTYPNNVPYGMTTTPSSLASKAGANSLPKPYPNSAAKKTAVRSGSADAKPYPGTSTLPGQASRTPVKKYKPIDRMKPQVETGKMQHFSV